MTTVAVVDTSALVGPKNRSHLVFAAQEKLCQLYWSPWIIGELYRVLTWKWFKDRGITLTERRVMSVSSKDMMTILSSWFNVVDPKPPWTTAWPNLRDMDDTPIWSAAVLIEADFVVSENTRDFPPRDSSGRHIWDHIEYIRTGDFLQRIGFEED